MDSARPADADLDFVEEFASGAEWFATHLGRTSARAPVAACPTWAVVDLVAHLGNVHSWAASIMETGQEARKLEDRPASARSRRMAEWYLAKAEDLYEVLRSTEPTKPCWNFAFGAGEASFWSRRQAHETVMHGVDLALAGDHEPRVPVRLAVDGVAEALEVFLWRMHQRGHPAVLHRPVELRALDAEVSWVVEPAAVGIPSQGARGVREGGQPSARPAPKVSVGPRDGVDRVEAPAATLLTLLWKRSLPNGPGVRLVGDEDRILGFLSSRLTP